MHNVGLMGQFLTIMVLLLLHFFRVRTLFRLLLLFLRLLLHVLREMLPILSMVLPFLRHLVDIFKPLIPCHVLSQFQVELFNTATQLYRLQFASFTPSQRLLRRASWPNQPLLTLSRIRF